MESRDDAYSNSLGDIESVLAENPSIQVVIDLHRDAVPEETRLVMDLDGRPTARFMFFNGLSRTKNTGNISYLYNENLGSNLAFSFQMQLKAMEYYPGLTRRIYLKGYRYNMHLRPKYLLIELGAQNNTLEEAMNACDPLAHILDLVQTAHPVALPSGGFHCRILLGFLLRRNLPAGLCFFGVSFFCFPLQYILEIFFSRPSPDGILYLYMSTRAHIYTGLSLAAMFAMVPALSLLLALVQAHWLHSRRASDLYHSLPIRRESLLLANAGAVFFTIALPLTLDYLIILGAGALRLAIGLPQNSLGFTLAVGEILLDWAGWMVTSLATIAVVLLVAVKIGSAFENLLFSLEVFCAPAGIVFISALVCDRYLTGFVSGLNGWELTWSTPLLLMLGRVMCGYKMTDMLYIELHQCLPPGFDMLLIVP